MQKELKKLPSVDKLLQEETIQALAKAHSHELAVDAARETLESARQAILEGSPRPPMSQLAEMTVANLNRRLQPTLRQVINATGVIIHTNLGRAPLSEETRLAMEKAAQGYSNLEYDLEAGKRGSRYVHAEEVLCRLTGAEAALVVNNNASAVLLMLTALTQGREVIISRSQLIEIGGGFRIPDVMRQSGARLVEVGTTNRTHLRDYEEAIGEETALLMRAHHSNFRIVGFTHEVPLAELVELGRKYDLPVIDDLGSGTLLDTADYGLGHEPTIQESITTGASLVSCSGDKLLGGPQAGIILGQKDLVTQLRRHPLTRALRVDKTTLAGLQATLLHYLEGKAPKKVPVWQMIAMPVKTIEERAQTWASLLAEAGAEVSVVDGRSTIGGGSLPGETLPTRLAAIQVPSPDDLARRLRLGQPAVVGRIEEDRFLLDPRTVMPQQEETLIERVRLALT
jgi:L-seryl-tRNA(Ser) seleniumtransferase